jgi:hypothetical protein
MKNPKTHHTLAVLALVSSLSACGSLAPGGWPLGSTIEQARRGIVKPTEEFELPGGGRRLEFAHGGQAKQTYMLDFDRSGVLTSSEQVLTESNLSALAKGTPAADVRMRFGRPVWVYGVRFPRGEVWNYRFAGGDCVWWQVTIGEAERRVVDSSVGPDPACDGRSDPHD